MVQHPVLHPASHCCMMMMPPYLKTGYSSAPPSRAPAASMLPPAAAQHSCLTWEVAVTHIVWYFPHTTCETYMPCSGLMLRGLTHSVSARSPCPHCPSALAPQEMTSSAMQGGDERRQAACRTT